MEIITQATEIKSTQRGKLSKDWAVATGGEDWPDAYRYTPMPLQEAEACVVVWWHPTLQQPVYQVYTGLLFGLPNAVTSFNRFY